MTTLQPGQKAPDFNTTDHNGNTVSLKGLQGKKVVLYFYPADDTPTCTKEACNYRDNYAMLKEKGYEVLGVSKDSSKKHQKFAEKYDLPFPLLVDDERTIQNAYEVYGLKKFMGRESMSIYRTTFVIDEQGIIEKVITRVDSVNAAQQVLE